MLFVSPKEPLTVENLPDTSLHNVRAFIPRQNCPSGSSAFLSSPEACVPKLKKEDLDLHREFLRLGNLLLSENADLFHQALKLLSVQHDLKVSTPNTSICDIIPQTRYTRRSKSGDAAASSTASDSNGFVAPRASFRKYVLPEETAAKEFYQCRVCKERRPINSFGVDHVHPDCSKSDIRWYCPLCDTLYAVTHRGYHLKSHHMDVISVVQPQQSSVERKPASAVEKSAPVKRARQEDRDSALLSPVEKKQATVDGSPSSASIASSSPSCCPSHIEGSPEEDFHFVSPSCSVQEVEEDCPRQEQQSFLSSFEEEQPFLFGSDMGEELLFPSHSEEEFFLKTSASSFSY